MKLERALVTITAVFMAVLSVVSLLCNFSMGAETVDNLAYRFAISTLPTIVIIVLLAFMMNYALRIFNDSISRKDIIKLVVVGVSLIASSIAFNRPLAVNGLLMLFLLAGVIFTIIASLYLVHSMVVSDLSNDNQQNKENNIIK